MPIINGKISLSVIIPCFNEVDTIGQVIKSVFDVGIDDIEIIVVDDGSVDGTKEKLTVLSKEKKIIYLSHLLMNIQESLKGHLTTLLL